MTIWEIGAVYTNKHNGKQIVVDSNRITDEGYLLWDAFYLPRKDGFEITKVLNEMDEKHWERNKTKITQPKGRVVMQTQFTKVRMLRKGDEEE